MKFSEWVGGFHKFRSIVQNFTLSFWRLPLIGALSKEPCQNISNSVSWASGMDFPILPSFWCFDTMLCENILYLYTLICAQSKKSNLKAVCGSHWIFYLFYYPPQMGSPHPLLDLQPLLRPTRQVCGWSLQHKGSWLEKPLPPHSICHSDKKLLQGLPTAHPHSINGSSLSSSSLILVHLCTPKTYLLAAAAALFQKSRPSACLLDNVAQFHYLREI